MRRRQLILVSLIISGVILLLGVSRKRSILPAYEVLTTTNGVPVYFFPSPNIPLFEVHLVFKGGSDLDPPGESGLGMFATGMIRRGVPGLDENAISAKLDDVAGAVEVMVAEDETRVASFGLNEHAAKVNGILFEALSRPVFPERPFQRLKTNHLDAMSQLADAPGALASHVLDLVMFNGTAKARPGSGFRRDVARIQLDRAREYYPALVRTDRLSALVIGGKDREILDRVVRGIEALPCHACGKKVAEPRDWDFPKSRISNGEVMLVQRPGLSEAQVRMGFRGPGRKIPEFHDLRVAETILSGQYASKLNLVIRERLNLTYGVVAAFNFGTSVGSFIVSTATRNEKLPELVIEVNRVLRSLVEGEVTDDDLRVAKDYLTGSFPLGLQNVYAVAGVFFGGLFNGLEPSFLDEYVDRINAVTVESLRAAVRKYMVLGQMKTVIVADEKKVGQSLRRAKIKYVTRQPADFL